MKKLQKLLPGDFRKYRFLSRLRLSPDGVLSAFCVSMANDKNSYNSDIYTYSVDGGIRRLTSSGKDKGFIWDSERVILFASSRDAELSKRAEGGEELTVFYRINTGGGEAERAFVLSVNVEKIEKTADGLYVLTAFADADRGAFSPPGLKKNSEKDEKAKIRDTCKIIEEIPFWSNGTGFTNKKRRRLFLYDEKKNELRPVTGAFTDVEDFKLSPCKRYIAYSARGNDGVMRIKDELYVYSIESDTSARLIGEEYSIAGFDVWKDSVVFAASKCEKHGINENAKFYIASGLNGYVRLLADFDNGIMATIGSDSRLGGGLKLKIDGDTLYFTAVCGYDCGIYALDVKTGDIRAAANGGAYDFFDAQNGKIHAVAFAGLRLQELYDVSDGACERLSSFNEDIYGTREKSVPEPHIYHSPDGCDIDGCDIHGWVMKPIGYEKGKKYPAILNIHGGPKNAFGDIYYHEMQLWANSGYFVIFCNPRGSDGKGDDFADIRGKYGACDYEDVMGFLDLALSIYPDIHSERLGVAGGSYGGFMTNWIIGHTDRFKAAASQRGISNWISFTYLSDIGYFFGTDQLQADAWGNHESMWEASPLKYADRVKTPTIFIHSDNDYRCWIPEAYQMFTALKLHGVETRLCVFHGESHELSRSGKPDNRQKRLEEILSWMDNHLKG